MVFIQDFKEFPSSVEFTDEGFMTATANIARVGIQEYLGHELGKKGDNNVYRVLRPVEVVKDSVKSFVNKSITVGHQGLITIKNAHKLAKGFVRDAWFEDSTGWIKADECINHPDGIDAFNDGYRWHSCGYRADINWESGEWIDELGVMGEPGQSYQYDASFVKIKGNHNALVKDPRAGDNATFDEGININQDSSGVSMTKKYEIRLPDNAVLMLDGENAADISKAFTELQSKTEKLDKALLDSNSKIQELESKVKTLESEKDTLSGQLEGLKTVNDSKPETSNERAEWFAVYDSVRGLIKDEPFTKTIEDLKIAGIKSVNPNVVLDGKSAEFISGMFESVKDRLAGKSVPPSKETLNDSAPADSDPMATADKTYREAVEKAWEKF
jgi:hypothetical protein